MHAEMDLLDRWEDRLRKQPLKNDGDPRRCEGIVLYSSYEPCPMCLVRIINSGIKKLYYVAPDPSGGMVTRMDDLPPFWRTFAQDREYTQARCSPVLSHKESTLIPLGGSGIDQPNNSPEISSEPALYALHNITRLLYGARWHEWPSLWIIRKMKGIPCS